jgi:hypothetical protein
MGSNKRRHRRPATTEENRESQLVSLAIDLAERQLLEGTASSQVMTHYLKLGSTREKLEQERLRQENELLKSKIDMLSSAKRVEELYSAALDAMRSYSGRELEDDYGDDPYEDDHYVDY